MGRDLVRMEAVPTGCGGGAPRHPDRARISPVHAHIHVSCQPPLRLMDISIEECTPGYILLFSRDSDLTCLSVC